MEKVQLKRKLKKKKYKKEKLQANISDKHKC